MPRYNNSRCCNMTTMPVDCESNTSMMSQQNQLRSLAVAYVLNQPHGSETYDVQTALLKGTIYPDLYKPYTGRGRCN